MVVPVAHLVNKRRVRTGFRPYCCVCGLRPLLLDHTVVCCQSLWRSQVEKVRKALKQLLDLVDAESKATQNKEEYADMKALHRSIERLVKAL